MGYEQGVADWRDVTRSAASKLTTFSCLLRQTGLLGGFSTTMGLDNVGAGPEIGEESESFMLVVLDKPEKLRKVTLKPAK